MAELTKEEGELLVEVFNKLKIKQKFDTAEDLQNWPTAYNADPSTTTVTAKISHRPKISLLFGDNVKGEATYAKWVYEAKCLLKEKAHSSQVLAEHPLAKFYSAKQDERWKKSNHPGIEPGPLAWQIDTLPRRYKSRFVPQGSTSVSYTHHYYMLPRLFESIFIFMKENLEFQTETGLNKNCSVFGGR